VTPTWKEGSIRGSTLSDALLLLSLSMLLILNYAVIGRHSSNEADITSEPSGPSGASKKPVGYSIFYLADVGDPLVVAWRIAYSQL